VCTLLVIVGTANHYIIDAVGGLVVFMAGALVQYLMSGRSAFVKAPHPPKLIRADAEPLWTQPAEP
jgi:hypothetical protein